MKGKSKGNDSSTFAIPTSQKRDVGHPGKVVIEYGRLEDFDALMERLAG